MASLPQAGPDRSSVATVNGTLDRKAPLFIKADQALVRLVPANILWIEAQDNNSAIFTKEQEFHVGRTLKQVLETLNGSGMVRIHRSYAVHIAHIERIADASVKVGRKWLPIGRKYRAELMGRIDTL